LHVMNHSSVSGSRWPIGFRFLQPAISKTPARPTSGLAHDRLLKAHS
jgi:hypothetical protein